MTAILLLAALVALPFVWSAGKRTGFERHMCWGYLPVEDRAPVDFVSVPCLGCGVLVDCAVTVQVGAGFEVDILVDVTDLESHRLQHEGV